jgi:hypothetical protein
MLAETATSGNTPLAPTRPSEPQEGDEPRDGQPSPLLDFNHTGYPILRPHEIDPVAGTLPPDLNNEIQAALNAQARDFELIPLHSNGLPADPDWRCRTMNSVADVGARWTREPRRKVGAVTERIFVVALYYDDPAFEDKLRTLIAENTAAMMSDLEQRVLLFFRRPPGMRSVEGELIPGLYVLSDDYVALPSGSPTDSCRWVTRYAVAPAPQRLLDRLEQLAALAASQTAEGIDAVSADAQPSNTLSPTIVQVESPVAEEWILDDEEDKDDAPQHEAPTAPQGSDDAFSDSAAEEDASSETKKDVYEIAEEVGRVADAPSSVSASAPEPTDARRPLTKLEAALDLARRGFSVFPITPNAKHPPLIKNWPVDASADEAKIREWWDRWPDANIGVPMDNMAAVDVDVRKISKEGWDEFADNYLPEENRSLAVKTWSDGRHIIYSLPRGLKLSQQVDAFAEGIDLKTGSNSYLIGVGSTIDGKSYEWANNRPIRELTPGLIECLQERKKFKIAQKSAAAGGALGRGRRDGDPPGDGGFSHRAECGAGYAPAS